ncbi:DUF4097 family beta strand repeat-containing protein [Paenibacillus riograndensis]|uniref:Putative membrane protein n=1 Tax=Paenibacillus riograndensis SBR5 TaxID=1073571 RepID=A0A0E4CUX1_9BACL|nr:DUF4097 family beta strand repeat-containing protein [Paenibacillus riograndensis]CQR52994.1 putative membrane protein [Paenibacillus riograndensis SBR5]
MKKWIITAVVLFVVGLIGVTATMWNEGGFSLGSVEVNQEQAVAADGVKDVVLSLNSINVTMVKGTANEIKASLAGRVSKKMVESTKLNLIREGDTVKIGVDSNRWTVGFSVFDVQVRVELPQQQYESFVFNSGTGDMNIAGVSARSVRVEADSGTVKLEGMKAGKISLELGSGDIEVNNVAADTLELNGDSTDVFLGKLAAQKVKLKTGGGNIRMKDVEAELELEADTGEVEAEMTDITHPINITTGSGEVILNTAERPSSAAIRFSHGSGELHNQWEGTAQTTAHEGDDIVFGDGSVAVNVKTGSGDLTLGKR